MKTVLPLFLSLFLLMPGALAKGAAKPAQMPASSGWELVPAGGKRSYKGIHGGTMPVSLLVSPDGQSLFTFVGRTGNDFLQLLRETDVPLPSLLNATMTADAMNRGMTLLAGSADRTLPVLPLATSSEGGPQLMHFGLSAKPLSIEGDIERPENAAGIKKLHISFNRLFFQPRRNGKKDR